MVRKIETWSEGQKSGKSFPEERTEPLPLSKLLEICAEQLLRCRREQYYKINIYQYMYASWYACGMGAYSFSSLFIFDVAT